METQLQNLCDRFIRNRDAAKKAFRWESSYVYPICAGLFCAKGLEADADTLVQCRDIIRKQVGIFSNFRGHLEPALASMLALGSSPEKQMAQALENYKALKQEFWGSEYLALAAFLLTDVSPLTLDQDRILRGRTIYDRMKKEHPFLTASEDSIFALLMAYSDKSDDQLISDMEAAYRILKERFHFVSDTLQTVSHVLALSTDNPEEASDRVIALYESLRSRGVKYGREYHMSPLAALTLMTEDLDRTADEIQQVDTFLSQQKGYGILGPGKAVRAMHAALIVSDQYTQRGQMDTAAMAGTLAMMIAQEIAMLVAISASTSAAASSSSNH